MRKLLRIWIVIKSLITKRGTLYGLAALLVVGGFVITFQFVDAPPPKTLTLASGGPSGAYFKFANEYAVLMKKHGITIKVLQTKGSIENIKLLNGEGAQRADLAFIQGGIESTQPGLTSLGSLYYEPIWVFYRKALPLATLADVRGKRIAVGENGSGTQALARVLLTKNSIDEKNASFQMLSNDDAAAALIAGNVDAMIIVAAPAAAVVKKLLESEQVELLSFKHAEAYTRLLPYLTLINLPEGVIDLAKNVPRQDIKLLAATANLVASEDLHPAVVNLLLQAAGSIHDKSGLFERAAQFPTPNNVSFPLNKQAKHYYAHGMPFLQRYLPFWLANLFDRLKILLLPLIGLLLPIMKIMPPLYKWSIRRRIFKWYSELRNVDPELQPVSLVEAPKFLARLDVIEEEVGRISVPLSYSDAVYNLRAHVSMVREGLMKIKA